MGRLRMALPLVVRLQTRTTKRETWSKTRWPLILIHPLNTPWFTLWLFSTQIIQIKVEIQRRDLKRVHAVKLLSNIWTTRASVSPGYPNTRKQCLYYWLICSWIINDFENVNLKLVIIRTLILNRVKKEKKYSIKVKKD